MVVRPHQPTALKQTRNHRNSTARSGQCLFREYKNRHVNATVSVLLRHSRQSTIPFAAVCHAMFILCVVKFRNVEVN